MKTQHTLIALAVSALFAAPAFASTNGDNGDDNGNFDPCPTCATATASVYDGQKMEYLDVENDKVDNTAKVKDDFMRGASGNIGVNVSAGGNNQQANAAAIAKADGDFCFRAELADASAFAWQSSRHNDVDNDGVTNYATLKDNAMQNVSGNVGLNIAAGDGNQQKNDLAIAVVKHAGVASATTGAYQKSHGNEIENELYRCTNTTNTAILQDNAMQNARGNIGVNVAAGNFNQQFNGLTVATAK